MSTPKTNSEAKLNATQARTAHVFTNGNAWHEIFGELSEAPVARARAQRRDRRVVRTERTRGAVDASGLTGGDSGVLSVV